jgi:hypothetical protein
MDTAKVLVLGGGAWLGLGEDPMVYVRPSVVEYRATQTRRQSKFNTLDMNALLTHQCFQHGFLLGIRAGWTLHRARYYIWSRRTVWLRA